MYVPPTPLIGSAFGLRVYLYIYVILKIHISLSKIKRLVFIIDTVCVLCEVKVKCSRYRPGCGPEGG
jgi:hypothetical protein